MDVFRWVPKVALKTKQRRPGQGDRLGTVVVPELPGFVYDYGVSMVKHWKTHGAVDCTAHGFYHRLCSFTIGSSMDLIIIYL